MRVVGYVRDAVDPHEGEPSFSQSEKIRRWTADNGHQLVAVCQDARTPGRDLNRDGLRALIGIVTAGRVDGVIVSSLSAFSPDKVVQEVMIDDLRARSVTVMTAEESELSLLEDPCPDQIRLLVRDVLEKARRHQKLVAPPVDAPGNPMVVQVDERSDVIVELVPPPQPAEISDLPANS